MRIGILLFVLLLSFESIAQKTLWASKVLEFSSERKNPRHLSLIDDESYKASQVIGEPNIYPGADASSRIWTPQRAGNIDFIKVGFEEALQIRQIAIVESLNPTAVYQVYAYDENGKEYLLNTFKPRPIPLKGRLLNFFLKKTPYKVSAVKVVINGSAVPGYNGIDAIAVSESSEPITIKIDEVGGIFSAIRPKRLSNNINSIYKDLKPLVTPDDNKLFLSRVRDPKNVGGGDDLEDIWISERDSTGEWQVAKNIGPPLNNKGPNFICSAVPLNDGYVLLLGNRYKKNKMFEGLSMVFQSDSGYSEIKPVFIENQENYSPFANYQLSHNRDIILMSVQRRNTYGDRDLYVTFLKEDGKWSSPKNLGNIINTSEEESSPFLGVDGKTMYFSSKGHLGYGGSDVYVTHRLDDTWTNWSEPENLGSIINTVNDEIFFHIAYNNRYAYYSQGDGKDADIFRFEMPLLQLPSPIVQVDVKVIDKKTTKPIEGADVTIANVENDHIEARQFTSKDGTIDVAIPTGAKYEIKALAEGYVNVENYTFDFFDIYENDTLYLVIEMSPIEVGQRISLDNIYFEFDKATLKPESTSQLDKVYDFLQSNEKVKVELDGHTCSLGSDDYNQKLSEARAQSVMTYLLDKGVKDKRLTSIGYGEAKPLESNSTDAGRVKNRRVEFVITEK